MQDEDVIWIDLIRQRGHQSQGAHKALFLKYQGKLKRFLRRGISDADASDLVQETFLRVWLKAGTYAGRSSVQSWIWSIAEHLKIDLLRRRSGREVPLPSGEDGTDPLPDPPDPRSDGRNFDYQICVRRGVHAFKEEHPLRARALTLMVEGDSREAIAQKLGRSVGATREYLSECRKVLEKYIVHCRGLLAPDDHDTGGHHD